ncbi:MAG: iron uptake porin, partial [Dolichospermum sp.]
YAFNLKNNIRVKIDATGAELNENVNVFNPDFRSSGTGALSRYGRFSPIYRQAGDGAGITVNVNPNGKLALSAAYFATGRDNNANNPGPGTGLFEGNNTMFGQLALKPNPAINIGLTYAHTYQSGTPNLLGGTGSSRANSLGLVGTRIEASNYGIQATLQPTKNITLGGWGGYTAASTLTGPTTNGEIWYWAGTLGIKDFIKEGNTLGLIVGQSPKLTGGTVRNGATTTNITRDFNTSYHIEGLYKVKLSDNILVTPGVIVILNPEHNDKNS